MGLFLKLELSSGGHWDENSSGLVYITLPFTSTPNLAIPTRPMTQGKYPELPKLS